MIILRGEAALPINSLLRILPKKAVLFDRIRTTGSNYYSIFVNRKLVEFGPTRSPKGFARIREKRLKAAAEEISVSTLYNGFPSFDIEMQDFFFGIELYLGEKLVADSRDFAFCFDEGHILESAKYSFQRGLIERYDFTAEKLSEPLKMVETKAIEILEETIVENAFSPLSLSPISSYAFHGFERVFDRSYLRDESLRYLNEYDIQADFLERTKKEKFHAFLFAADRVRTGLFDIRIRSESPNKTKAYVCFDEVLMNGKMAFGRANCNDLISLEYSGGVFEYVSSVPYCFRYVLLLVPEGEASEFSVSLIPIENEFVSNLPTFKDEEIECVYRASAETYRQNSYDLYTDCPGRERAPWICDSYFMGLAEKHFCENNDTERRFLINYLHQSCKTIPEDAFPMCYPSDHPDGTFIPNWCMWLILEIDEYRKRNNDETLAFAFKEKIYRFCRYISNYENENGLLENLPSWVFVEWSKANDYVSGVNFPTNMLYSGMLKAVGDMFKDDYLFRKGERLCEVINRMSFNGEFYRDHALRDKRGALIVQEKDISESAQHYAIFFEVNTDPDFKTRVLSNEWNSMNESAIFIGKTLKMLWLLKSGNEKEIIQMVKRDFLPTAQETGTLWEKTSLLGSCNHGFASVVGYVLSNLKTVRE